MNVLIVYSHPNPESFTSALRESFARGLSEGGHESQVIDLYKMILIRISGLKTTMPSWEAPCPLM